MPDVIGPNLATKANTGPWRRSCGVLLAFLFVLALPDLLSPPISPTILRQTQTYAQTVHFLAAGFSPTGLTIDIDGPKPFHVVYEFPLYHALAGSLFALFGPAFFWGKLVSLLAALAALNEFLQLVRRRWGDAVALRAGLLFASCPITLLLASAFQPDALALFLALLSVTRLVRWRDEPVPRHWWWFLVALLAAGLAKFTLLVPLLPLLAVLAWTPRGRLQPLTFPQLAAAALVFLAPFVGWYLYRAQLMDPSYLASEDRQFFLGDLGRFLHAGFYLKPAFILGAMVCCGTGLGLLAAAFRQLDRVGGLLLAGGALYFVLIPTAALQTYYALPLVPIAAVLMAQGALALEVAAAPRFRGAARTALAVAWFAGVAIAAPYTLRQDRVTLAAAEAARTVSQPDEFLLVMNMHDRGVGIGGFNPAIVTLAERRGWNVRFDSPAVAVLLPQIEARRREGAHWLVTTWFTPDLEPWFAPLLPAAFSRCPQVQGVPVDGRSLTIELARRFPVVTRGKNFAVLRLD